MPDSHRPTRRDKTGSSHPVRCCPLLSRFEYTPNLVAYSSYAPLVQTRRHPEGLTEIAGLDIDGLDNGGRIWAVGCNQLKITIERFYQLTGT